MPCCGSGGFQGGDGENIPTINSAQLGVCLHLASFSILELDWRLARQELISMAQDFIFAEASFDSASLSQIPFDSIFARRALAVQADSTLLI